MPNNVTIAVQEIRPSHRKNPTNLATAVIEIAFAEHSIVVDDVRVLNGKKGPWVAMPAYSLSAGKDWTYHPTVILDEDLQEQVADTVLDAYRVWTKKSTASVNAHGLAVDDSDIGF